MLFNPTPYRVGRRKMRKCEDCGEYFEFVNYERHCKKCNAKFLDKLGIFDKIKKGEPK